VKKVLFLYIVEEGFGIVSKAKKTEHGFRDAGCDLTVKSCLISKKKLPRLIQIVKLFFDVTLTLTTKRYDVVFVRHAYYFLPLFLLCWILQVNIQLEINTKEKEEFLNRGQWLRARINSISFFLACKCSVRNHAVTYELLDHYKKMYPQVPIVFNPNFVVDEEYIEGPAGKEDEKVHMVFLGNAFQQWQGLSEFVQKVVVANSWLLENCCLHIVGECGDDIKGIIERNSLQESVIIHGYLRGQAKRDVVTKMHIGIGVFNMEAKSMIQATPIKIGEYLYAGLPVIIGYDDPRLHTDQRIPMWLRIDIHKENDLHSKVNEFIRTVRGNREIRKAAHEFARSNMLVKGYIDRIVR
jgi:hypothetical protein